MDSYLTLMGITLIILLCFSAFFSATEMAITSLNPIRIKMHAEEGNKKAIKTLKLLDNYNLTITSIVVGNNIVNILLPTISTLFFTSWILDPNLAILCSTGIMSIIVIFFGEIIPKIFGNELQEDFIYKIVDFLSLLIKILYFITQIFLQITNFIQKHLFPKNVEDNVFVEEELLSRIEEGREDGVINEYEEELMRNAIEFEEIRVEEILQPKSNMFMIDVNTDNDTIYELLNSQRYSRVPVYENDPENIIGILSERDFLTRYIESNEFDVHEILRETHFVSDTMLVSNLLAQLQSDRSHMAIVVDEYGTIQGLITVEDIIEEIVGEIWDEHDEVEYPIKQIAENEFLILGTLSLGDFNEYFESVLDFDLTSEHENTIAGFIIEYLQAIPQVKQTIDYQNITWTIDSMDNNRINTIKMIIKEGI